MAELNIKRLNDLNDLGQNDSFVPEWQKNKIRERLADYEMGLTHALDFDEAMNEIEREL